MVFLCMCICNNLKRVYDQHFVDKLRIYCRGGTGGNGLPAFGGKGGHGGNVFVVGTADEQFSLNDFKYLYPHKRFIADVGENSQKRKLSGLNGSSLFIKVPCGIAVVDAETKRTLGDICKPFDKVLVAKGGLGGSFKTNFLPKKGQKRNIFLDLKLIADVGFVGFPNAGKSTLLSKLSKAQPEIAAYPFTTIKPELGIIKYPDFRSIQLADLPGLIEGAFMNKGRGHTFLKHIERTRLLLFVIDINGFQLSPTDKFRDAFETVQLLTKELELYNQMLINRCAVLAVNKMDSNNSNFLLEELKRKLENWEDCIGTLPENMIPESQITFKNIFPISAKNSQGLSALKQHIRYEIDGIDRMEEKQLLDEFKEKHFLPTSDSSFSSKKLLL